MSVSDGWSRRRWLAAVGWGTAGCAMTVSGGSVSGCGAAGAGGAAPSPRFLWTPEETALLDAPGGPLAIPQQGTPAAAVLRLRAREVDPASPDLARLEARMRETLEASGGVGLAAPQVALPVRVVVVALGVRGGEVRTVFCPNPRIVERTDELEDDVEGCLSIDPVCGVVRRHLRLVVVWDGPGGEERLPVEGFDARIFQHEIDHLDGVLFTDRLVGAAYPKELLRPLRAEIERRRAAGEAGPLLGAEIVAAAAAAAAVPADPPGTP